MLDFLHQDKDPETGKVMRRVRSFVLREGRLTQGQRKALDTLWPDYGLERAQGVLDARAEFGRDALDLVDRVQLYFPDPWHKKKHHKRRIVQPDWVALVNTKLRPGGVLHMATDWQDYAEHMMAVMNDSAGFVNTAGEGCFAARPGWRPETKFERRGAGLGHGVWDLLFEKSL